MNYLHNINVPSLKINKIFLAQPKWAKVKIFIKFLMTFVVCFLAKHARLVALIIHWAWSQICPLILKIFVTKKKTTQTKKTTVTLLKGELEKPMQKLHLLKEKKY